MENSRANLIEKFDTITEPTKNVINVLFSEAFSLIRKLSKDTYLDTNDQLDDMIRIGDLAKAYKNATKALYQVEKLSVDRYQSKAK